MKKPISKWKEIAKKVKKSKSDNWTDKTQLVQTSAFKIGDMVYVDYLPTTVASSKDYPWALNNPYPIWGGGQPRTDWEGKEQYRKENLGIVIGVSKRWVKKMDCYAFDYTISLFNSPYPAKECVYHGQQYLHNPEPYRRCLEFRAKMAKRNLKKGLD